MELLDSLGDIPSPLRERITAQKDETTLPAWLKLAAKAENIEEFQNSEWYQDHSD